ncbi:thymidylate kinase [Listeria rocourtiae]|uniref:thymidylate kinase n=1 Tax=Listeria rocourtiae TaxID=647910 RepID=UPI00162388DB|nr:thymidylate kinase [Listeria rocourtiae]MBC1436357.1 thymidylate kinase [Listeria rocourtiae]
MNTKLIMIEGLPGSGKSTLAVKIANYYQSRGLNVSVYTEGTYHPADLAWIACIPEAAFPTILEQFGSMKEEIHRHTKMENGYALVAYTQVKPHDDLFYQMMESYEVYDNRVPFSTFTELHWKRWKSFGDRVITENGITIFECSFLQNHIGELMNYQMKDLDAMKAYFNELLNTVVDLSPVLIYLSHSDIRETIERVSQERVFDDGSWIDGIIPYYESTPYGKKHNRVGMDGFVQTLMDRKEAELEIIESLPIETFIYECSDYDWDELWLRIESNLPK